MLLQWTKVKKTWGMCVSKTRPVQLVGYKWCKSVQISQDLFSHII